MYLQPHMKKEALNSFWPSQRVEKRLGKEENSTWSVNGLFVCLFVANHVLKMLSCPRRLHKGEE